MNRANMSPCAEGIEQTTLHDCWNRIGVMGDRSCDQLAAVMHCYDRPVYAAAGDSLLKREPPQNYLDEWIHILTETPTDSEDAENDGTIVRTANAISVMIFRLGNEWLSLPVRILQEVTPPCVIQPVPHRSNELFLGLVNIRGETLLCASLSYLLNLESDEDAAPNSSHFKRMILAGKATKSGCFPWMKCTVFFAFICLSYAMPRS